MRFVTFLSIILLICFACTAWAQDISGTSNTGIIDYMTSTGVVSTPISQTYVDLADLSIGPCLNEDSLVKIDVSFVIEPSSVPHFDLRVLYDGNPDVSLPARIALSPGGSLGYHTFTFLVHSGPGCHTIEVQARSKGHGSVVTGNRMLTSSHN